MVTITLWRILTVALLGTLVGGNMGSVPGRVMCKIRCGIVTEPRGSANLLNFVEGVWRDLKLAKTLNSIEVKFVRIKRRLDMTMDELIEAYMEIGTTNASAIIGQYMQPVATATEKFGIPYFVTSEVDGNSYKPYNLVTVFPKPIDLYRISVDVVRKYDLQDVVVFYETMEGLYLIEDLVQNPDLHVRAWKIDSSVSMETLRQLMLQVRQIAVSNVIVMCSRIITSQIMEEALHLSMLSSNYLWILPSWNQDEDQLMQYAYTQVNLTTFHLVQNDQLANNVDERFFTRFEYATVYDSLLALYNGIRLHHRNTGSCHWGGKDFLLPILSKIGDTGATGHLSFRRDGTRQGYVVSVLGLGEEGLYQIGRWNSSVADAERRLEINNTHVVIEPIVTERPLGLENIKVVTILEAPFVRLKDNHLELEGNDKFEGYCIDLFEKIANILGFKYEIYLVPDGQYGDIQADGTWNGMVEQLMNGNASMSIAPLMITSQREHVIDFSKPFKTLGIGLIMKRPKMEMSLSLFVEPLSGMVWAMLLVIFVFVSLTLYLLDKLAPVPTEDGDGVRFSPQESVWFTFSSMVLSGTAIHPKTVSARILAGALWFFSLIIISSYTANLAAFLTVSEFTHSIKSVNGLLQQTEVKYGTVHNSGVSAFFARNKLERFQQMWQYMSVITPSSMVDTSEEGFQKVQNSQGEYVFMWESPVIEYYVRQDCTLMEVGEPFTSGGYGIGVPLGARYRDDLTMTILKLGESGDIQRMESKWWTGTPCPEQNKATTRGSRSLTIDKIGGVFIVLGSGIGLSVIAAIIEYLVRRSQIEKAKNRKVNEKKADKPYCDGRIPTSVQLEEPFLSTFTKNPTETKIQTNIF